MKFLNFKAMSKKKRIVFISVLSFILLALVSLTVVLSVVLGNEGLQVEKGGNIEGKDVYNLTKDGVSREFWVYESAITLINSVTTDKDDNVIIEFNGGKTLNIGRRVGIDSELPFIAGINAVNNGIVLCFGNETTILIDGFLNNSLISGLFINEKGSLVIRAHNGAVIDFERLVYSYGDINVYPTSLTLSDDGYFMITYSNDTYIEYDFPKNNEKTTLYNLYRQKHEYDGTSGHFIVDICLKTLEYKGIFEVSFNSGTDKTYNTEKVLEDRLSLVPESPTKDFYSFVGWEYKGILWDFEKAPVKADMELLARWTPVSYSITYHTDGGTYDGVKKYNIESANITLGTPEKPGYVFIGWTSDNTEIPEPSLKIEKGSHGDLEFYANYKPQSYDITYELSGGTTDNPSSYNIETDDFVLTYPKRDGYNFVGWKATDSEDVKKDVTVNKGTVGSLTFTAVWEAVDYKISYELSGGIAENPDCYNVESEDFYLVSPEREGYLFKGWTSADITNPTYNPIIKKGSIGDKTFVAVWEKIVYKITYNTAFGMVDNITEFTVESEAFELKPPTSFDCDFLGWYDSSGNPVTEIPKGTVGDIELEAKFGESIFIISEGVLLGISDNAKELCREITLPEGIEIIVNGAISGCKALMKAVICDGVVSIGDNAFSDCSSLSEVYLPKSLGFIGKNAFDKCEELSILAFSASSDWYVAVSDTDFVPLDLSFPKENAEYFKNGNATVYRIIE